MPPTYRHFEPLLPPSIAKSLRMEDRIYIQDAAKTWCLGGADEGMAALPQES